ncbi:MAG: formyltransferase family protein [bacterium]|nr:formyltransferase family protein [bacterium]
MKIIFIGTVAFSRRALEKLVNINANVVGVITKRHSPFNSDFADLTDICIAHNIPCQFVEDINAPETILWIKKMQPDIIFCFGWSNLIKEEILSMPPLGVIGFHPAAVPQNRGRHPLIWALALGLKESASTFFFMGKGADDGDILSQRFFEIKYEDDATTLYEKTTTIALSQIEEFVPQLESNTFSRIPQDHLKANYWRKRSKLDGKIDFRMSSYAIYNLVRALTIPYVGAHIEYKEKDYKIWVVKEIKCNKDNIEYGKVLEVDIINNSFVVKCYDNAVKIIKHEFETLPKIGEYL